MKFIVSVILFLMYCGSSAGQALPVAKSYHYFSEEEEWQLKIVDFKTVELWARAYNESYSLVVDGKCELTDSTICFLFDSSVTRNMILKDSHCGPNVKEFINGNTFKRENDYIIPNHCTTGNKSEHPGISKKSYYQQVELNMGGTKVELNNKNQYILTRYFCTGHWVEKGKYIPSGNILTLKPDKKSPAFSGSLMDGSIIYAAGNVLISKKLQPTTQPEKYSKEEVFLYFLQQ